MCPQTSYLERYEKSSKSCACHQLCFFTQYVIKGWQKKSVIWWHSFYHKCKPFRSQTNNIFILCMSLHRENQANMETAERLDSLDQRWVPIPVQYVSIRSTHGHSFRLHRLDSAPTFLITDGAVLCHMFQGSRGFPGTPGPPGLKGHRVSISSLKHSWTCWWALLWLDWCTIFTVETLMENWTGFTLPFSCVFFYSFSACLLTNTLFANRAMVDHLAKKVKLELSDPRY